MWLNLEEGKKTFWRKGPFSPPQTPPLFSKPFIGICFLPRKKSNALKILENSFPIQIIFTNPYWGQSLKQKLFIQLKKRGGSNPVPLWVQIKQSNYLVMTLAISRTLLL